MVWIKCNICGEEWTQTADIFAEIKCPNGCLDKFSQELYFDDLGLRTSCQKTEGE